MTADIVPDVDLARAALRCWTAPYQAEVMTGISLVENGGDRRSFYLNPDGLFVDAADRGPWANNEVATADVQARKAGMPPGSLLWQDPRTFHSVDGSARLAKDNWQYRFDHAMRKGWGYTIALVYAYCGWSTYAHSLPPERRPPGIDYPETDKEVALRERLQLRFAAMRPRAKAAVVAAMAPS